MESCSNQKIVKHIKIYLSFFKVATNCTLPQNLPFYCPQHKVCHTCQLNGLSWQRRNAHRDVNTFVHILVYLFVCMKHICDLFISAHEIWLLQH
jgi:hypothetical protein